MTDCVDVFILQAIDHEMDMVMKEMERALGDNKTLAMLYLRDDRNVTLPKEFCRHVLFGITRNTSLSEVYLKFHQHLSWDCPIDGRLVYVSHMLCDSVGCSV